MAAQIGHTRCAAFNGMCRCRWGPESKSRWGRQTARLWLTVLCMSMYVTLSYYMFLISVYHSDGIASGLKKRVSIFSLTPHTPRRDLADMSTLPGLFVAVDTPLSRALRPRLLLGLRRLERGWA